MNKDALLDHIYTGRSRWESALAQLTPDQMIAPTLFDGWFGVFAALLSGQAPDFEIDEIALDAFNARFFADLHDQSLAEVMAGEQAAYRSFRGRLRGRSVRPQPLPLDAGRSLRRVGRRQHLRALRRAPG